VRKPILTVFLLFFWCFSRLTAQDIHYAQFFQNPIYANPALAGVSSGDMRFSAIYRNQWSSVPVPYRTFSAHFDQKAQLPFMREGWFGFGGIFTHDKAGDAGLSWNAFEGVASYIRPLTDEHHLSAGFKFGLGQRAFDPAQLTFGDQFNGDIFLPDQASMEVFDNPSFFMLDFSAGMTWFFKDYDTRTSSVIGMSFSHLNQPVASFKGNPVYRLPIRYSLHGMTRLQLTDFVDLEFNALWNFMAATKNMETVFMLGARYFLEPGVKETLNFGLGGGYRLGDAFLGYISAGFQNWRLSFSYDVNISPFEVATFKRGGPEISIQYLIYSVKPPNAFKACPIF
jgi:type IX secretion system PorP/SprF family membrane protein